MANFVSRNVLICVVPTVVLLISLYWFKKKKKMKPDLLSSVNEKTLPIHRNNDVYDSRSSICSPVENSMDFTSNTLSDASSISSPANSQRTMSISGDTSSDNVVDDVCIEALTISNHIGQLNYNEIISDVKGEKIIANCNSKIQQNGKSENSNGSLTDASPDCEELNNTQLKENVINSLCNIVNTSLDEAVKKCSPEDDQVIKAVDKSDFSSSFHNSDINSQAFLKEPEQNSVPEVSIVNEIIEDPVTVVKLNNSESAEEAENKPFEDSNVVVESDSQDSHSSVLDENSLSSVSDESERQTDFKYKDSPSSVFDGNSIVSDESDKTDISNEHNTINLKPAESSKDNVDNVCNDIESVDPNKSNEQYSIKLKKNSFFVKTISSDTANEVSSSNCVENILSPVSCSQHNYSALSDSFQSFPSQECFISVSKDELGSVDQHYNQPVQLSKEIDSSEDNNFNSSVATSLTSEIISLDSENIISSTSSDKNFNQTEDQSEINVNTFNSETVSSSDEVKNTVVKMNGSEQLDSTCCVNTDASSGAIKTPDEQLEQSHNKVADLDVADIKSSGVVPGLFVYEFDLPQELCGRLIGRQGKHVKSIKERTNANVFIKRHPFDNNLKTVVVEGSRSSVHEALDNIRRKFPPSQFPNVSLIQTNMLSAHGVSLPESLQLHLPEGASCDVILSSLVSAGHFFLQQPTHPTYPSLSTLDQCMITCYTQMDTPLLPQPVEAGVICAAPVMNGWFRAQIVYVYENRTECEIKFVDYGGFSQVSITSLRQIRSDFMTLPFQASECYLANVRPVDRNTGWSSEATSVFEELAQGQILQALLVEYAEDGIPCVHLYRVQGVSSMFINRELVERGLAVWVDNSHWDPH